MPSFTMTKNYRDGTTPTEEQLDAFWGSLETFINLSKLGGDNFQTGFITAAKLTDDSIDSSKLDNAAVTAAKLDTSSTRLDTDHFKDESVTTAKINTAAVTQEKLAAANIAVSADVTSATVTSSVSFSNFSGLTATLTAAGTRLVFIFLVGTGGNNQSTTTGTATSAATKPLYSLTADGTDIGQYRVESSPCGLMWVHVPSAGEVVYQVQGKVNAGTSLTLANYRLVAVEYR